MLALKVVLFIIITATVVGIIINENVKNMHDIFSLTLNAAIFFLGLEFLTRVTDIWGVIVSGVSIVFSTINVILIIMVSRMKKKEINLKTKLEINIEQVTDGLYKSYFLGIDESFFNFFAIGKTRKESFELLIYGMNELINAQKLDYNFEETEENEWDFK